MGKNTGFRKHKDSFMKDFLRKKRFKQRVGWNHKHYKRKSKHTKETFDDLV